MGDYMKIHTGLTYSVITNASSCNNLTIPRKGEIIINTDTNEEREVTKVTYEFNNTSGVEINVYTKEI